MKIAFITKFPPIEGGVSSRAFWLARGLGRTGNEVHVVTNAWEVEPEYSEVFEGNDLNEYSPPNVTVHNTNPFALPEHIPYSKAFVERLSSLAIRIVRENDIDLIDSWYMMPYCVAGHLAKIQTGVKQVVRHAGSDVGRLMKSPDLKEIFLEVFRGADRIITYPQMKDFFLRMGLSERSLHIHQGASVDTRAFHPEVEGLDLSALGIEDDCPVFTHLGKVGVAKGTFDLVQAFSNVEEECKLLLVTGGKWMNSLRSKIETLDMEDRVAVVDFVPPWRIPPIMASSTSVVIPEWDFPIQGHRPIIPREAMACATCTVMSKEIHSKWPYKTLEHGSGTIVVNPKRIREFGDQLQELASRPEKAEEIGRRSHRISEEIEDFEGYIEDEIRLYKDLL